LNPDYVLLASIDDEKLNKVLRQYYYEGKMSNKEIKVLLEQELGYQLRCMYFHYAKPFD